MVILKATGCSKGQVSLLSLYILLFPVTDELGNGSTVWQSKVVAS